MSGKVVCAKDRTTLHSMQFEHPIRASATMQAVFPHLFQLEEEVDVPKLLRNCETNMHLGIIILEFW
ncbi:hypothetical protein F442_13587 [Phytophthora nicotianae P10297]|uniref:Uncharacterized protein n=4 Tax=Phytophthora nicotianae TaxID=4792 RepID=W2R7R2_PHYN3|nr:hypothetical protein PPTG_21364 [Phytophthora nicotianae INRA-310]ETM40991.1 hypothetical protein L914_13187 [Phytophthora nicotianae]ETN20744.1 hypothetical protein PPTG_21364 [Phytophthora nicotianae INRA-310]ETO69668.1 hypothetical protein F444_13794 [Phytophthora nicotianae P1976]ETP38912.1 hypothetical protein F442_13587 [Phytophthora nicotianae P10297]